MSPQQIELMRRCLHADRHAQHADEKLIEVGWITGVRESTAISLVSAGLLVEDVPTWANERTHMHVRLPNKDEISKISGSQVTD